MGWVQVCSERISLCWFQPASPRMSFPWRWQAHKWDEWKSIMHEAPAEKGTLFPLPAFQWPKQVTCQPSSTPIKQEAHAVSSGEDRRVTWPRMWTPGGADNGEWWCGWPQGQAGMQGLCHVLYGHDCRRASQRPYLVGLLLSLFFSEKI